MKRIRTLYRPDMMRANLAGRKSQTRRLLSIQPPERHPDSEEPSLLLDTVVHAEGHVHFQYSLGQTYTVPIHRYGRPGDLLLACETHYLTGSQVHGDQVQLVGIYTCDGTALDCTLTPAESLLFHGRKKHTGTVPGRFMYTSLSRLAQPLTEIRVERLQSITESDAIAEGIEDVEGIWRDYTDGCFGFGCPIESYTSLWDSLNPDHPFTSNPWVVVLNFQPYQPQP